MKPPLLHQVHNLAKIRASLLIGFAVLCLLCGLSADVATFQRLVMKGAEHLTPGALVASTSMPPLKHVNLGEREVAQEEDEGEKIGGVACSGCRICKCGKNTLQREGRDET